MSLYLRLKTIISSRFSKLLDKYNDPRDTLDYSYEKQQDLLENVKSGITEVSTAKKQLEMQKSKLEKDITKFDRQAKELIQQGNEPLARAALERKASTQQQVVSLTEQIEKLNKDQDKLVQASKVLEMKIEELKATKETVKAQYTAAEASMRINESLSGLSNEVGNVGQAMERAKDKTEQMAARSSAIDELTEAGVLSDSLGNQTDTIDRELTKAKVKSDVDNELRRMKRLEMVKKNDLNVFVT